MLEHYNHVFPGCAERILKMAEDQAHHRQDLERSVVQAKIGTERRGQWFGFLLGLVGIAGGVYLVRSGQSITGFGVFLTSLGTLVGVFLYGQRKQAKELEGKRREVGAGE